MKYVSLIILGLFLPAPVGAAVTISEVAWMGSTDSANYEWIELSNDGAATDVTGWILTDELKLSIELAGVVPANSYVVLERTSEASAPGSAFMIYTGALGNDGRTLKLFRADGGLEDQVAGGTDWQNIGGDNVTKETAQYTSSGWMTGMATPSAPPPHNAQSPAAATPATASAAASGKIAKPALTSEPVKLELPGVTLELKIDAQSLGYVNQPIDFSVSASGIGQSLINSLSYVWNFGDGLSGTSESPTHAFAYPGTYVVAAHGVFKRQEQVVRHEITILPVAISLTTNTVGDVQVNNDSPYEIDVSGYRIKGNTTFTFPVYSVILPNQTVTIPKQKVQTAGLAMVGVYDQTGVLVTALLPSTLAQVAVSNKEPVGLPQPTPRISASATSRVSEVIDDSAVHANAEVAFATAAVATQPAAVVTAGSEPTNRFVYVGFMSVLLLGVLGVYTRPQRPQTQKVW